LDERGLLLLAQGERLTLGGVEQLSRARATRAFVALVAASTALLLTATAPAGAAWKPGPERYGIGERHNVPVTMRDGTVLRANVLYPTDPSSGDPARGRFPVIMVQTPYGKDAVGAFSGREGGAEGGPPAPPHP
jgi:predicted acyl esterase